MVRRPADLRITARGGQFRLIETNRSQWEVCGLIAETPPHRPGGQAMNRALPITLPTGTVPAVGSPVHSRPFCASAGRFVQCARESAEWVRLSPITQSRPWGTLTGPNSLPRQG